MVNVELRKGGQLLDIDDMVGLLNCSKRKIWSMTSSRELPQPIRLGSRTIRWRLQDIESHLERLADAAKRRA